MTRASLNGWIDMWNELHPGDNVTFARVEPGELYINATPHRAEEVYAALQQETPIGVVVHVNSQRSAYR